jgi:dTDP-4-amino-4,6-dideoxygalactose transaminase
MRNDPFQDSHQIPLARPWFDESEVEAAAAVVRSLWLCQGPKTAEFETAFAARFGVRHAIAVSSGSTALLVALQAMGISRGDEVIVPNMTFISTVTSAMLLGARPVFCDITLTDYNIDAAKVEALVTPKTKAIIPVHYAGHAADMKTLKEIAQRHNLLILEDAAEAHLARFDGGDYVGAIGDAGIFSFTPTKPMTTGEGGMIVTNNDELADACRLIRNFGDQGKFQWTVLGFNYRLNEIASAIGLCQLSKLDHIIRVRREKAKRYDEAWAGEELIHTPWVRGPEDSNYQLYTIRLEVDRLDVDRDAIIQELSQKGVSTRLYYPSLHGQKVFAEVEPGDDSQYPNSLVYEKSALSIPIFTGLTADEQQYVIKTVAETVRSHEKR